MFNFFFLSQRPAKCIKKYMGGTFWNVTAVRNSDDRDNNNDIDIVDWAKSESHNRLAEKKVGSQPVIYPLGTGHRCDYTW